MPVSFKGAHCSQDIILMGVRWYVAYPLSYRHVEELMEERGVSVDHATVQRGVVKYSPQLEAAFHRRKRPVGRSWRLDETYIRVKGEGRYLYRAVDTRGRRSTFCSRSAGIRRLPYSFSRKRSAVAACLRRSRSTAVRPMKWPSSAIMRSTGPPSSSGR